jgi:hypothetical protein
LKITGQQGRLLKHPNRAINRAKKAMGVFQDSCAKAFIEILQTKWFWQGDASIFRMRISNFRTI